MIGPIWLTEADVVRTLDLSASLEPLRAGLRLEACGLARNLAKTVASWGGGDTLHALGAVMPGLGFVGTKTWAHTEGGASPLLILWNSEDGSLAAIIEAFALGQFRTAAVCAIATDALARKDASDMAIVGTGKQALPQIAAVAAVRDLRRVRIFGPSQERRSAFAAKVRKNFTFDVVECADVREAVAGAHVVTLVTRATSPFLRAVDPSPGAHINAVGAIVPSRMEFEPELLQRCAVVCADSPEQAQSLSREFALAFEPDGWERVVPLSALVADEKRRPATADLTLFKAMGMGISDVALGHYVVSAALKGGFGTPIGAPQRIPIKFSLPVNHFGALA